MLNCDIVVIKFDLQLCYSVDSWTNILEKAWTPLSFTSYELNSTTIVLLEGYLWHLIIYQGWYAIKNKPKPNHLIN